MAKDFKSPEDRRHLLDDYKQKIYNQFWTRLDNPRMANNAHVGKIIADFEKTAPTPKELVELLLHRVALPISQAMDLCGGPDENFTSAFKDYEKALKIIVKEQLETHFKEECLEMPDGIDFDFSVAHQIERLNEQYFGG